MSEQLKEIAEIIQSAYEATNNVIANGQNLDHLAAARQMMRKAFYALKEAAKEENPNG